MVLELIRYWLCDRLGCEPEEIGLSVSFDELNVHFGELTELAVTVGERFGVEIPDEALDTFATVEDLVGYVEDRL